MHVQENDYEELAGDPDHLQTMASKYLAIADRIRASVPVLHTLSQGEGQKSQATDALKEKAGKVADDIEKAESRYRVTAEALLDYAPQLRSAQADAHTAVVHIRQAETDVQTANRAVARTDQAARTATTDADKATAATDHSAATTNATHASADLERWKLAWRDARDHRDTQAGIARNRIDDVIQNHNNGLKNPEHSFWDSVVDVFNVVRDVLIEVGKWAGVLSIFLAWVPILGDILIVLAVLGAVMQLVKDIQAGHTDFGTMLGDSLGIVLSAFGGGAGKFVGKLAAASKFSRYSRVGGDLLHAARGGKTAEGFRAAFGVGKNTMRNALRSGDYGKLSAAMRANLKGGEEYAKLSSTRGFLDAVKNPFKFTTGHGGLAANVKANLATTGEELGKFKASWGGLESKRMGFDTFKDLNSGMKLSVMAVDARKVLSTTEKLVNFTNNHIHGDWAQSGTQNPQVYLSPEKVPFHLTPAP